MPAGRLDEFSLIQPLLLEVRGGVKLSGVQPREPLEEWGGIDDFGGFRVIIPVIGFEEEGSPGRKDPMNAREVVRMDKTVKSVALFGPGIGEEEMNPGSTTGWQEPRKGVSAFKVDDPDIGQALADGAAADLADASAEAFDPEEITLWIVRGHLEQEGAVATTDVEFQRTGGIREDRAWRDLSEIIGRNEFHGRWRQRGHAVTSA